MIDLDDFVGELRNSNSLTLNALLTPAIRVLIAEAAAHRFMHNLDCGFYNCREHANRWRPYCFLKTP